MFGYLEAILWIHLCCHGLNIFVCDGVQPTFDVPSVNVTILEGQTALLPCSVSDLGEAQVMWRDPAGDVLTIGDQNMAGDDRLYVVHPNTETWNLVIQNVRWDDQGEYHCMILGYGYDKRIYLYVRVPAMIIDESSSRDTIIREGDDVSLICNVTGQPPPQVTWYINGKQADISSCPHGYIGTVYSLSNVSRTCSGQYMCVADNGIPPAVSRHIELNVQFCPAIHVHADILSPSSWLMCTLECNVTANPTAYVLWTKDGKVISKTPQRYDIRTKEHGDHLISYILYVYHIQDTDLGTYICIATNFIGSTHKEVQLFMTPRITLPMKHLNLSLGSEFIMQCIVTSYPASHVVWSKDGENITESNSHLTISVHHDGNYQTTHELQVHDVQRQNFGNYSCNAFNLYGTAQDEVNVYEQPSSDEDNSVAIKEEASLYLVVVAFLLNLF